MTNLMGVDIAWDRPTIAQIKATGAHFVARYFSTDATKNLQASEVVSYPAAGLSIVTVWETTAGRALAGFAAGVSDAKAAELQRKGTGLPSTHVHYFAVDQDTTWAKVQAYFQGVVSVIGMARTGCYGGYSVIQGAYAFGIRYLWQTSAWSKGQWSAHTTIRQTGATTLSGQADVDNATTADYGQFPRPETDMPLTTADINAVAAKVVGELTAAGPRDELAMAVLYWLNRAVDPAIALPTGKNLPGVVAQTATLRAALTAQRAASAATIAAVAKAVGTSLTVAQITAAAQAGAEAALAAHTPTP